MNRNTSADPGLKKDRVTSVTLTVICQGFQALSMGGIALLLPLIRTDLGLTFTQGGSLAAATTLVYAMMQIPAGSLSDRFSPKRLFFIGILGTTVLALTFGLVTNYWQALLNQILSGFFRALLFAPGMVLLTGWFPENRRATATGLYLVGGATGSLFFNLAAPFLVAWYGWRFAFISVAAVGIMFSFILLKYGKDSPETAGRSGGRILDALQLFRYKIMWVCGGIQYIRLGVMQGITYWLPSLLIDEKYLSLELAGVIVAVQSIMMVPANIFGGYISDRLRAPVMVIGVSLAALGLTTWALTGVENIVLVVALVFINALFLQMYFGPLFAVPVEVLGTRRAGASSGFSNFFANLGGFSATYLLGALKDATGAFKPGFLVIAGACLVGLALTVLLGSIRRRLLREPAGAADAGS